MMLKLQSKRFYARARFDISLMDVLEITESGMKVNRIR